ncbi:MAG TPA: hypothetical protein VMW87_14620 [Spirochaetia bacterium]|nr:hypothetical protein [Spirochaetia bacterium]
MLSIRRKIVERFALNAFVTGDYERAEKYFLRLKSDEPDRLGADHNMGLVKLGLRQYAEAEAYFLRDRELFGGSYLRSRTLGDLYYIWGDREKASKWYSAALKESEDEVDKTLLRERVKICSRESSFAAVQESHRSFEAAVLQQKSGELERAREMLELAVQQDPTNFQAWNNLGSVFMEDPARQTDAVSCFTRARAYSSIPAIVRNLEEAEKRAGETKRG